MGTLALKADERVLDLHITNDTLTVDLMDGRTISVPLVWYPKLFNATVRARKKWQICGGGYGIHWPEIDEDLSTEGLLRGAPAPQVLLFEKENIKQLKRNKNTRLTGRHK